MSKYRDDWDNEEAFGDEPYEIDDHVDDCDDATTTECPECGEEVYDDALRCPRCENYIIPGNPSAKRKPLWIVVTAIVCIYAILQTYLNAVLFAD